MITIQDIWDRTKAYGYLINISGQEGFERWQPLKHYYATFSVLNDRKFFVCRKIINYLSKCYRVDSHDTEHKKPTIAFKEKNVLIQNYGNGHFIVQHFRIPQMAIKAALNPDEIELSILKIAQIAYNAGQFIAECDKGAYSDEIINHYSKLELGNINTYLDKADISIDSHLLGQSKSVENCIDDKKN